MALGLGFTAAFAAIPEAVHPDFDLSKVPFPEKYKTMGLDFLADGRMVLGTTEFIGGGEVPGSPSTNHKIFLVSGAGGASVQMTEISNNWLQIAGLVVVNNKIYVSDRDGFYEINQLTPPADLKTNRKLIVKWPDESKWNSGFQWHQFVFTPMYKGGSFYAPYSGSIRPGGPSDVNPTSRSTGAFLKWDLTGKMENYAGGLRSPNGSGLEAATGDMMVADNQGSWLPSSTLMLMKPGKYYGHSNVSPKPTVANWAETLPYEPPVAWLPHGTVRASPSQPLAVKAGPYAGHWLLGDVNNPGLLRISVDKIGDATPNGAVFWFSKGFANVAINRMAYGTDGAIYIGTCQTIAGNWPGGDKQDFFRMAPKASPSVFEMKAVYSLKDGIEIEYTQPVDVATADKANYAVKQWQYIRSVSYGAGKQPDQALTISESAVSADGKRVYLKIAGLVRDRVVYVKQTNVKSASAKSSWNDEVWYTHNTVSTRAWNATVGVRPVARANAALESAVSHRVAGQGILSVTVGAGGPWKASLLSPDGSTVAAASGIGESRFQLSRGNARAGLHLLRVTLKGGEVVRKVLL